MKCEQISSSLINLRNRYNVEMENEKKNNNNKKWCECVCSMFVHLMHMHTHKVIKWRNIVDVHTVWYRAVAHQITDYTCVVCVQKCHNKMARKKPEKKSTDFLCVSSIFPRIAKRYWRVLSVTSWTKLNIFGFFSNQRDEIVI